MPAMAFRGVVTKSGVMNKTATVTVSRWVRHQLTGKMVVKKKKLLTHDEQNVLQKDDEVLIRNCRPLSARKRFTLEKIVRSPETESKVRRALLEQQAAQQQVAQQQAAQAQQPASA
ncbi:hypothetical protein HDZ31DRAFT_31692 [Schizophyllum fasciatum]